jgi:hypothetical protein
MLDGQIPELQLITKTKRETILHFAHPAKQMHTWQQLWVGTEPPAVLDCSGKTATTARDVF